MVLKDIKTILKRIAVKNCFKRDIKTVLGGTVVKKCKISSKSIVSRASPSPILSCVHSSQHTHFSHSHSLTPHFATTLQPRPPSHHATDCHATSIILVAQPRPNRTAPKKHQLTLSAQLHRTKSTLAPYFGSVRHRPRCTLRAQPHPTKFPPFIGHQTPPLYQLFIFFFYLLFVELTRIFISVVSIHLYRRFQNCHYKLLIYKDIQINDDFRTVFKFSF